MARTNLREQFTPEQRANWQPKIIAHNTFKFVRDGEIVTRLHGTDIVTEHSDGSVTLNSGGWKTVTTKDRMQKALSSDYSLFSDRGQWYITRNGGPSRVPFYDGIRVPQCFDKPDTKGAATEKREKKLRADIKEFVAKLDTMEALPAPSPGDCWFCALRDDGGKPLGELSQDTSHLRSHLKEGYLHGSLIYNAIVDAGYRDPRFIWQMEDSLRARGGRPTFAKRALRRYLLRKLGLAT